MKLYHFWLIASILASLGGIAAFLFLYVKDINIYWLIISPIILTLYQAPAVILFKFYKKYRRKAVEEPGDIP